MARLISFQKILKEKNLGGFIVTNPVNIFYLSGFRGISPQERESILIFSPRATLITAKLYQTEALKLRTKNLKNAIADGRNKIFDIAQKLLRNAKKVGFEGNDLKYTEFKEFKKRLPKVNLNPFKNFIEDMRILKTADEIRKIEKAQIISQK